MPRPIKTMEDFSEFVGLSRPTVSKYFNDPSSVRKKTRDAIEEALRKSGFKPNMFAVNLNRRRSNIIGIIIPNALDPFYMALTRQIQMIASEAGFLAFVLSSDGKGDLESDALNTLRSMNVAGAIIAPVGTDIKSSPARILGKQIPLVYIDAPIEDDAAFVGSDNRQSFGLIVDYLCRSGEPPAFFGMPAVNRNSSDRQNAYIEAMESARQTPTVLPISNKLTWEFEAFAFEEATRLFDSLEKLPTRTIVCANDRLAFGVIAAAWQKKLKIGHGADFDLRVAGHDDHPLSQYACPPLTTVAQNYSEIGHLAIGLLLRMLDDDSGDGGARLKREQILLKSELRLRASA